METLYRLYAPRMMQVIRRYVGPRPEGEDILHDGFILIYSHIHEVKNPERLEFWMGTIIRNLSLQFLHQLDLSTILDEEIEVEDVPEMEELLSLEELERLINRLPEGYRRIFRMAVMEKKSHKEIGEILGINPRSSSSQLHHAKAMLRRLINERRMELGLGTLLLLLTVGTWLPLADQSSRWEWGNQKNLSYRNDWKNQKNQKNLSHLNNRSNWNNQNNRSDQSSPITPITPITQITPIAPISPTPSDSVSVGEAPDSPLIVQSYESIYQEVERSPLFAEVAKEAEETRDWSMSMLYSMNGDFSNGLMLFAARGDYEDLQSAGSPDDGNLPSDSGNGSGNGNGTSGGDGDGDGDGEEEGGDPVPPDNPDNPETPVQPSTPPAVPTVQSVPLSLTATHEMPLTFGLTAARRVSDRVTLETGVTYTLLRSNLNYHIRFNGTDLNAGQKVRGHYIGIPLKVNWRFAGWKRFSFYATAGGEVAFPAGTERGEIVATFPIVPEKPHYRTQFSLSGGLGVQFRVAPGFGIYLEPSARYHFDNGSSMPTYWQEHPFSFSIPLGLRIIW